VGSKSVTQIMARSVNNGEKDAAAETQQALM